MNHIYGRLAKDLVPALMAWHIGSRPVYLLRAGRTLSGVQAGDGEAASVFASSSSINDLAGNPGLRRLNSAASLGSKKRRGDVLCSEGIAFRKALWDFLHAQVKEFILKRRSVADNKNTGTSISGLDTGSLPYFGMDKAEELDRMMESMSGLLPIRILTSTMPRAVETVSFEEYDMPFSQMSNLNPIDKGDYSGMEMEDIKNEDPVLFSQLQADSFSTRYVYFE